MALSHGEVRIESRQPHFTQDTAVIDISYTHKETGKKMVKSTAGTRLEDYEEAVAMIFESA